MSKNCTKGDNPDTIVGGFVRAVSAGHSYDKPLNIETPRPDELTQAALSGDAPHPRPWTKLPRVRKGKLALMGLSKEILNKGDPRYSAALRLANKYRKVRAMELSTMHGYVSAGASALLATGSLALAASRFLYEKFAETSEDDEPAYHLLKQAASLADSARQSELAAWEMSAREGLVRKKLDAAGQGVPWLRQDDDGKAKPGRKTNAERLEAKALGSGQLGDDFKVPAASKSVDEWIQNG